MGGTPVLFTFSFSLIPFVRVCDSFIFLHMQEHYIYSLCIVLFLKQGEEQKTLFLRKLNEFALYNMNGMFNLHHILIACSLFAASFLKTMRSLNTHVNLCNL